MYNTILFDLDGTLLNTTEGVIDAVKITLKDFGLNLPPDKSLQSFVGPPMQKSMAETFKLDSITALKIANKFRENYKKYSLFKAALYPDVVEMLKNLKDNNFKIAIATNKSHNNAEEIIKHFKISDYCDYYLGSDLEGKLSKTDIINQCINTLKAEKSKSVLIGDSKFDSTGAEEAGIDFIGVTYGFGFKTSDDFKHIKNKCYFNNIKELENFLINQKRVINIC